MKKLIFILFLFGSVLQAQSTYKVTSGGGEDYTTIAQVNAASFNAGDSILFNRGETWRETLTVPSSGSSGDHIIFSCYGTGERPKILGSDITTWSDQTGNIWKSDDTFTDPRATNGFESDIYFDEAGTITWGVHVAGTGDLAAEYEWTWVANYIYVYAASDPDARYTTVEIPQRANAIMIEDEEYITLDSLDVRYAQKINIYDNDATVSLSGFTLSNCHLGWVGSREDEAGYNLAVVRNDYLVQNCEIHEGGRRNISFHIYDASDLTFDGIIIEGNELYSGYHGSGFGIAMDGGRHNNHFKNIIIRNNLMYNESTRNPSVDGFASSSLGALRAGETDATIEDVSIYNNIFKNTMIYAIQIENVDTIKIYNNTFYDFNHNIPRGSGNEYQLEFANGNTQVKIKNNIFYGTGVYSYQSNYNIVIQSSQLTSEIELDYNLFYQSDASMTMVYTAVNGGYYRTTGDKDWDDFKSDYPLWQANGPGIVDPEFTDDPDDLSLTVGSPAIGAGIGVGILKDYNGDYHNDPPDIGAIAYDPVEPEPPELPVVTTEILSHTAVYAIVQVTVTDVEGTVSDRGVTFSLTANPTVTDRVIKAGSGTGTFRVHIPIVAGVTFHVRGWAINQSGTSYGSDQTVTGLNKSVGLSDGNVGTINGKPVKF